MSVVVESICSLVGLGLEGETIPWEAFRLCPILCTARSGSGVCEMEPPVYLSG